MKYFLSLFLALSAGAMADNIAVKVTDAGGLPVNNARVVAILKSGAHQDAKFDPVDGNHKCQPTEQCVKVFAAAPNFEAVAKKYSGAPGVFPVAMKASNEKSSSIAKGWARLPGIEGAVSLNYSSTGRFSMDAGKMAFAEKRGGKPIGRATVELNRPIDMITSTGQKFKIWVVDLMPQVSLLEYTTPK